MARIPFQNVNLDKTDYTINDFPLGAECEDEQGREYVFVKYNDGDGTVTCVAGMLVVNLDSAYPEGEATSDQDSATIYAVPNNPKGFIQAVIADGGYGWAQKRGRNRQIIYTDGSITQGMVLFASGGDGTVTGNASPGSATYKIVGTALEADNASSQIPIGQAYIDI